MSSFLGLMIPIIAIISVFGLKAYKLHLQHRGSVMSNTDRQLVESLVATAQRLDQRVATLERALLENESAYSSQTGVAP